MPRQTRRVPPTIGRFNYWLRWIARPDGDDDLPDCVPTVDKEALPESQRIFRAMRDGTEKPLLLVRRHRSLRPILGAAIEDDRVLALAAYIARDRRWQENREAWALHRQLSKNIQERLERFDERRWRRGRGKKWSQLLRQIAKDQLIFHEILLDGVTGAGVVEGSWRRLGTKRGDERPSVWKRHGISRAEAKRIYDHYIGTANAIRGLGVKPLNAAWAKALHKLGFLDKHGRVPTEPISSFLTDKSRADRKEKGFDLVHHYFAHALCNLHRYQSGRYDLNGSTKLLWDPNACMASCVELQLKLARQHNTI